MNLQEEWRDVHGYEGLYQVSDLGNIYSNYIKKILKKSHNPHGYTKYNFCKDKKIKQVMGHRIVLETFFKNINNYKYVRHKNGIKDDDKLSNLEWSNQSENMKHTIHILGKGNVGKKHSLYRGDVNQIYNGVVINTYTTISKASEKTGICRSSIAKCCIGQYKQAGGFIFNYKICD